MGAARPWAPDDLVLVTGGWGMLGRAVRRELASSGHGLVLAPTHGELDLLDGAAVGAFMAEHRPAYVIHLAAVVFGLLGNMQNQARAVAENTLLNHNVLTACVEHRVRKIFFAGTVASYPHPYVKLPLTEDALWHGQPHYGEFGYANAKRHALAYLEIMRREHGLDFFYGLLTNLYGPHDRFGDQSGHVVPSLVGKLYRARETGAPFEVWGDGRARRDFMYVEDAARAILVGMERISGAANVCSGTTVTIRDVVDGLVDAARYAGDVVWQTDRPVGILERSVSDRVLRGHGFAPRWDLPHGLGATWDWYLARASDPSTDGLERNACRP